MFKPIIYCCLLQYDDISSNQLNCCCLQYVDINSNQLNYCLLQCVEISSNQFFAVAYYNMLIQTQSHNKLLPSSICWYNLKPIINWCLRQSVDISSNQLNYCLLQYCDISSNQLYTVAFSNMLILVQTN